MNIENFKHEMGFHHPNGKVLGHAENCQAEMCLNDLNRIDVFVFDYFYKYMLRTTHDHLAAAENSLRKFERKN